MKFSKDEIQNLQKSLFLNMKKKALSFEGEITKELKSYRKAQKRYSNRNFKTSTLNELIESIDSANLIFLGDFHTFDQNSKNLERILKNILKSNKNLSFGLEFVFAHQQRHIDEFLQGNLTELEFLEAIDYFQSWRFPWRHYSFIFNFAKKHDLNILALNSVGTLDKRDQFAAEGISQYLLSFPEDKMLVLFGELHIMPNKIPKQVNEIVGPEFKQLIIHQNLDDIFWRLKETKGKRNQDTSIIKFNDLEYSLQVSPPWIKYESMIYWYENTLEDPEFDLHEYLLERKGNLHSGDLSEKFLYLSSKINDGLDLGLTNNQLEYFNIFNYNQLEIVLEKLDQLEDVRLDSFYRELIAKGKPFCIPGSFDYYCPNISVNKISMLIGFHLRNVLNQDKTLYGQKNDIFLGYLSNYFSAHFCAKILNPYKKCDLYLDLLQKISSIQYSPSEKKIFQLTIKMINEIGQGNDFSELIEENKPYDLFSSAKLIGSFLGDIYYQKIDEYNQKEKKYILNGLIYSNPSLEDIPELFVTILKGFDYKSLKKDYF